MDGAGGPHRKRCKRYDLPGQAHCLTFSCFGRQAFLSGRRSRGWLLQAVLAAKARHGFDLWAWVIMPEHVHLLVLPREGTRISPLLGTIKQSVSKRALLWVRLHRPAFLERMPDVRPGGRVVHRFWQRGGGYDRNLWTVRYIHETIAYIHENPVRRGLVEEPGQWAWSSWRAWHDGGDDPLPLDRDSLPPLES